MKQLTIWLSFMFLFGLSKAQSPMHGLISHSYLESTPNGDYKKTVKTLYIIYNDRYCELYINGQSHSFTVDSYSRSTESNFIKESFISAETGSTPRGWYSIDIIHNHQGGADVNIQLSLFPGGKAFDIKNAKDYTKDGKTAGVVTVTVSDKELEARKKVMADLKLDQELTKDEQQPFESNKYLNDYVNSHVVWTRAEKTIADLGSIYLKITSDPSGRILQIANNGSSLKNISHSKTLNNEEAVIPKPFITDQVRNVIDSIKVFDSVNFKFNRNRTSIKKYKIDLHPTSSN